MTKEQIKQKIKDNISYLDNGANSLAKKFNADPDTIRLAKKELRAEGYSYNRNIKVLKAKEDSQIKHNMQFTETPESKNKKILIFDIETAPIRSAVWGIWNQNINLKGITSEWFMLTWAAKWYGEDTIYAEAVTSQEALEEDDSRITKDIWDLLDEADIVVSHNGDKFDIKKLNTRFILHNLAKPSPYHSIDTLKQVRKNFSFTSNKLDYVNQQLGIQQKLSNSGMEMWVKAIQGNQKALNEMLEYNIGDIDALEELYSKLKPWFKGHPPVSTKKETCPVCGEGELTKISEFGKILQYDIYRCDNCKALSRNRKSNKSNINRVSI